ncbi:hypothetical protein A2Y26_03960 [candidate division CPR2 bacterium GWD2_39_7]|nr:MAG: GGDEF/response regulator receiver domain protein [candidate division CPR2 bacterium GW2011_GWD1_39_7]OGB60056.1 MAG: hypothetical protein A2Y27_02140 [candidate division CPR2 bacterium GWD1_39_7]OGB71805.1 MAG: hypothetical protein A2Y26_03960 [candidate division CPR2 bacterium GWD2_39_7]
MSFKLKQHEWLAEVGKIAASSSSPAEKIEAVKLLYKRIDSFIKDAGDKIIVDELTGFINQPFLGQFLDKRFLEADDFGEDISVVVFEIKLFDIFWDGFGDLEAARAISKIASVIEDSIRDNDLVCRFETNKFVLILPDTHETQALRIAETIALKSKEINFEKNDHLELVYGIASKSDGANTSDGLFEAALAGLN